MELLILICLLIIIALLVKERIVIKIKSKQNRVHEKVNPDLPDIMGQPKPIQRLPVPNAATEGQPDETETDSDNLDIEYDPNEVLGAQIPLEELDEVFGSTPDFEEEEDEWSRQGTTLDDLGFAQGVTFDELAKVGKLLQQVKLEQSQKLEAVEIVQKIQGTELFYLLESSMNGASRKIAQLLDSTFTGSTDSGSSSLRNDDPSGFDIVDFV